VIVVVLSTPSSPSLVSWLIRKITRFKATHASIHIKGRGMFAGSRLIFESTSHGVSLVHPSTWDKNNRAVFAYEMVGENEAGAVGLRETWKLLGADYDYLGLFHFGWRMLMDRIFGVKVDAPITQDTLFCSELVARWLNEVKTQLGIPLGTLRPDEVSPAGLSIELERSDLFRSLPCEELSLSAIFT